MKHALVAIQPFVSSFCDGSQNELVKLMCLGVECLELRLDFFLAEKKSHFSFRELSAKLAVIDRFLSQHAVSDMPQVQVIGTCRRTCDGGVWQGAESLRRDLFQLILDAGFTHLDLEVDFEFADALISKAQARGAKIIRSYHNLQETPPLEELEGCVARLAQGAGDILKCVSFAQNLKDNWIYQKLLLQDHKRPLAAFCMGPQGIFSRIFGKEWGSVFNYGVVPGYENFLPEIPSYQKLLRLYPSSLSQNTEQLALEQKEEIKPQNSRLQKHALYAVVGQHVRTSLSPYLHMNLFPARRVSKRLEKHEHEGEVKAKTQQNEAFAFRYFDLESRCFEQALEFTQNAGIRGLSVTHPFKAQAAELAQSEGGKGLQEANTLFLKEAGWCAANTDQAAFREDLREVFSDQELSQSRVLVWGYGGSAGAVVGGLQACAGEIVVGGRNLQKAQAFAQARGVKSFPGSSPAAFDLIVHCTPLGMLGGQAPDSLPFKLKDLALHEKSLFYDLVYNPLETPLMAEARSMGFRTRGGLGMLVKQAALQQEVWFGARYSAQELCLLEKAAQDTLEFSPTAHHRRFRPARRIALVGYRGVGKSTLAPLLAEVLELPDYDLDALIERGEGEDIASLFETRGEAGFRQLEYKYLREVCINEPAFILACGGGSLEEESLRRFLWQHATVIYMQASQQTLLQRLKQDCQRRPNLTAKKGSFEAELQERLPRRLVHYEALADYICSSDHKDIHQVRDQILKFLLKS